MWGYAAAVIFGASCGYSSDWRPSEADRKKSKRRERARRRAERMAKNRAIRRAKPFLICGAVVIGLWLSWETVMWTANWNGVLGPCVNVICH